MEETIMKILEKRTVVYEDKYGRLRRREETVYYRVDGTGFSESPSTRNLREDEFFTRKYADTTAYSTMDRINEAYREMMRSDEW